MRSCSPTEASEELEVNGKAGINTMMWGPPGSGKSDIVYDYGVRIGAKIYELRANLFDPVDVRGGLKVVEQKDGSYRTRYGVPEDYPPSDYTGLVLLFIEELPNAPKATMNALLQLLLSGRIGTYSLPINTIIVAAGNRASDRAAVHEMPTPVKNRFAHIELEPTVDDFCKWGVNNGIDESITSFIRYRPKLLHAMDATENAFPTPRTWAMLSKKLPFIKNMFTGCASIIGDGPAGEYIAYRSIYKEVPDVLDIIKKPSTVKVPTEASALFATAGTVANAADQTTFKAIMKYVNRMPKEYQVVAVKDSLAKDLSLQSHDSLTKWTEENADILM
jgi:hypothetical protein